MQGTIQGKTQNLTSRAFSISIHHKTKREGRKQSKLPLFENYYFGGTVACYSNVDPVVFK